MNQANSIDQATGARSWKLIESLSLSPWLLFGLLVFGAELYFASERAESLKSIIALNISFWIYSIIGISLSPSLASVTHDKNKILRNALIYFFALVAAGVLIPEYIAIYFEGLVLRAAPFMGISVQENGLQFYSHHLFALSILPALVAGFAINLKHKPKAVLWVWIIPASIVGYKILTFHSNAPLGSNGVKQGIIHFFGPGCEIPAYIFDTAPECISKVLYIRPLYATVAYAVGAFVAYSGVLRDFFPRRITDE